MLDGGLVFAVFMVGGEDGAIVELTDGGMTEVPVGSGAGSGDEGWGRCSSAFSDDEFIGLVPGDAVFGEAAADAPGWFHVAVDGEDAVILKLNSIRGITPKIRWFR
jgi:hypothetical protein